MGKLAASSQIHRIIRLCYECDSQELTGCTSRKLRIFGIGHMLPRLRFVFAAALIAAFPWILLGSGVVTTAQNTPVSEQTRVGTGVAISAGDLRDAQHMHALAFVRRSRELERLRELGSAPLSDWVVAPAGMAPPDDAPAPGRHPRADGRPCHSDRRPAGAG